MNHLDPLSHRGPLSSSLGPPLFPLTGDPASTPHYHAFARQENLNQIKPSTSSRYLFPSPRPSGIPQENPHYIMNPPIWYSHLVPSPRPAGIPPSSLLVPGSGPAGIPPSTSYRHYLPQYPSASTQGGGFMPATSGFTPAAHASLVSQVAGSKFESKGKRQDQECDKKMSDEQLMNSGTTKFEGSCFRCGKKYHKAGDCPQKKKMLDEQLKNDSTVEGSCFRCGEKDHKATDCPRKKKKMSDEQLKNDSTVEGSCFCCGQKDHKFKDCPNPRKKKKKKMSDGQPKDGVTFRGSCSRCGKKYHRAEDCPQKKKKKKMSDEQLKNTTAATTTEFSCYHCGEKAHKAKNCPQKRKISDEQPKKNGSHSRDQQGYLQQGNPNSDRQKALSHLGPECQQGLPQHFTLPTHGKSLIGTILHQLCSMKFDSEGSVCEYILKMENLVCRLRELKMEVSDDFLVHMVLNALPEAFNSVKLEYYSTTDIWNVNELIANCVHEEARHEGTT